MKLSNSTFNFDILVPCQEDWNKMEKKDNGRYCDSCEKIVVDFSNMSNQEMVEYFQNAGGNICGKIQKNRLENNSAEVKHSNRWASTFKTLGLLLSGLLIGGEVNGQTTEIDHSDSCETTVKINYIVGNIEYIPNNDKITYSRKLWGIVLDENGIPLTGVKILPKAPVIGTQTDKNGHFVVNVPPVPSGTPVALEVSLAGYEKIEIAPKKNEWQSLRIILKKSEKNI